MAVTILDSISASHYNTLRTNLNTILQTSYGQTPRTAAVTGFGTQGLSANQVTSAQMLNLFLDIQSVRVHQTGAVVNTVAVPSTGQTVGASTVQAFNQSTGAKTDITNGAVMGYNDYEASITAAVNFNGSVSGWPDSSFTLGTPVTSVRTASWGTTATVTSIYHVVTVTFASQAQRNNFFNAGGEIRFGASMANAVGAKDTDWSDMFTTMGTIKFDKYSITASSGTPNASGSGFDSLTSSYRLLYTKTGTSVYAENTYTIEGYNVSTTQLRFRITLNDKDVGDLQDVDGNPVDEEVTGDITSSVNSFRPDSEFVYNSTTYTGVSVPAPTIATQVALSTNNATIPA